MARHLSIDLETFSSVDLKKSGMFKYVESPDFQILLFAYSLDGGPVQLVDLAMGETLPPWLAAAIQVLNAVGALTLVYAFRHGKAIVVEVSAGGLPATLYCAVDKETAVKIVEQHVAAGQLVQDHIFDFNTTDEQ